MPIAFDLNTHRIGKKIDMTRSVRDGKMGYFPRISSSQYKEREEKIPDHPPHLKRCNAMIKLDQMPMSDYPMNEEHREYDDDKWMRKSIMKKLPSILGNHKKRSKFM